MIYVAVNSNYNYNSTLDTPQAQEVDELLSIVALWKKAKAHFAIMDNSAMDTTAAQRQRRMCLYPEPMIADVSRHHVMSVASCTKYCTILAGTLGFHRIICRDVTSRCSF